MTDFNHETYSRATARRDLAQTDLDELAQQVKDGELDETTAARLRNSYQTELAAAQSEIDELGLPPIPNDPETASSPTSEEPDGSAETTRTGLNGRWLVGAAVLAVALTAIVISVQRSSVPSPSAGGVMSSADTAQDPCAELATALTSHAENGSRLALADCYVASGDVMSAIEHYQTVGNDEGATDGERSQASFGLGVVNLHVGEFLTAADHMRAALDADEANIDAQYFLGMLLVYDLDDPTGGIEYLESVLETPSLAEDVIEGIETALAIARGDVGGG